MIFENFQRTKGLIDNKWILKDWGELLSKNMEDQRNEKKKKNAQTDIYQRNIGR